MTSKILPHLYQALAEGAMFGIVVFDQANGECLFINSMAQSLLGTEAPTMQTLILEHDRPPFKSFSIDILQNDGLHHDIMVNSENGVPFIGNLGVRRLHVDGRFAYLVMMQDVTIQKKMQRDILAKQAEIKATYEELLKQNRQLRELDVAKDRFIALTTHELRTPLAAMVSSAEILKMGLYDTPEQMNEFINMIHEQGLHLQELVNDILDFAKIQAGKMDFYIGQKDPIELVQNLMRDFEAMAESYNVSLKVDVPSSSVACYYDELRLKQIISNIVNNAIKYNRAGGHVRIHFADEQDHIKILIEDTGKGIPEDQFSKVFNEFETVGQVAQHHKGTGLGMPISRKLAEGMGGKLLLQSTVGVGSTFWVEIPKEKVLDPGLYRPRLEQIGDLAS